LNKTDWKSYLYPSINYLESSESETIQISKSNPIVLGRVNFSITKTVDRDQVEIGEEVEVSVIVRNSGTIGVKSVDIKDSLSFSNGQFSLTEGKLVNQIECLSPGEACEFSYTIRAKTQASTQLNPAKIDYYFLSKRQEKSNPVEIKIIIPKTVQLLYIIFPSIIGLITLGVSFYQSRYKTEEKLEQVRNEMKVMSSITKDSILHVEYTLGEELIKLSKKSQKELTEKSPESSSKITSKEGEFKDE
jgi:uncharacterized repeat protein (TIGR01451 family)